MITARSPLPPTTATEPEATPLTDAEEASLLFFYRHFEDEEFFAIIRQDFAAANLALSSRLAIKARLLADQVQV